MKKINNFQSGEESSFVLEEKEVTKFVKNAIERRRSAIVYGLARMFLEKVDRRSLEGESDKSQIASSWIPIESLSQLRSQVGGRFKNLKEKWIGSGLPLREHRGDREGEAEINQQGWVELSLWIAKQGFETRLIKSSDPESETLFEIRRQG